MERMGFYNITIIENYATGNAFQYIYSNQKKPIHGRNRGYGQITRQAGGHGNDETIRQVSRDMANTNLQFTGNGDSAPPRNEPTGSSYGNTDGHNSFGRLIGPVTILGFLGTQWQAFQDRNKQIREP